MGSKQIDDRLRLPRRSGFKSRDSVRAESGQVGQRQTRPGQFVGTSVQGGETHKLTKGDVIVVPAGIPHWFKEVPKSVNYYVVKVLKP